MHIDNNYHKLLETILTEGYWYDDPNREGVKRLEIPSYTFRHEFKYGFPAISTKRLAVKGMVYELIQFLSGDTDITWLKENGCKFWDKDVAVFDKFGNKNIGINYPHQWTNFGGVPKSIPIDRKPFDLNKKPISTLLQKVYSTKSYGDFIITKEYVENKNTYLNIIFTKTHTENKVRKNRINNDVYDMYAPSILNIACLGNVENIKGDEHYSNILNIWKGMINRCYNEKNDNYSYYGNRGVFVCNRWKCFEYFYQDVQKLENWELKIKNWNEYNLDKDIKSNGFEYSFETCKWASKSENISKAKEKYEYTIENIHSNEQLVFKNHSLIIKQLEINNQGNFSSMLRGERKICEGWTLVSKRELKGINQIQTLIEKMITTPMSSELLVSAWNPYDSDKMSLPPCHYGFQVIMRPLTPIECGNYGTVDEVDGGIDHTGYGFELHWNQRSCDTFLGVPINITSYALLALILEKATGHKALAIQGDLKKVHLYDNSIDGVKEQLSRKSTEKIAQLEQSAFTEMFEGYDPLKHDYDIFTAMLLNLAKDIKLINYEPQPAIKVEMLERK